MDDTMFAACNLEGQTINNSSFASSLTRHF